MEMIGPDLEVFQKWGWKCGVLGTKRSIYCKPFEHGKLLKINTIDGIVEAFDIESEGEGTSSHGSWMSGTVGPDECIYL